MTRATSTVLVGYLTPQSSILTLAPSVCAFHTLSMSTLTALSSGTSASPYSTGTLITTPHPSFPAFFISSSIAFSPSSFVCPYRFGGDGSASTS